MQQDPPARTMVLWFSAEGDKIQYCFDILLHWAWLALVNLWRSVINLIADWKSTLS